MGLRLGQFRIDAIQAGLFRLDGGAMFGVVPKNLWATRVPNDEQNRIHMGMRCWVVRSEATGRIYLVDTGAGTKGDDKFRRIYALEDRDFLAEGLAALGLTPDAITDVVLTHLHFDHGGGVTRYKPGTTEPELVFRNARHWVTREHLETAKHPNQREKASFLKDNVEPLFASPLLSVAPDEGEAYEPGFGTIHVHGHTLGMQLPLLEADGKTLLFAADLFPTHAHIPLPWIMGYDMRAIDTLAEKERVLKRAHAEGWYVFLEHDAEHEVVTIGYDGRHFGAGRFLKLDEV